MNKAVCEIPLGLYRIATKDLHDNGQDGDDAEQDYDCNDFPAKAKVCWGGETPEEERERYSDGGGTNIAEHEVDEFELDQR
jgi:hypothetical protein